MNKLLLPVFVWALALAGCQNEPHSKPAPALAPPSAGAKPDGKDRPKLWLTSSTTGDMTTLVVHYEQGPSMGPRVADIRLAHSESFEVAEALAGDSALAAGKELTVQKPQAGLVRLILLSRNTNEMKTGELARLSFQRRSAAAAKVDVLMDKPVFAPAESMQGLMIGDPVQL